MESDLLETYTRMHTHTRTHTHTHVHTHTHTHTHVHTHTHTHTQPHLYLITVSRLPHVVIGSDTFHWLPGELYTHTHTHTHNVIQRTKNIFKNDKKVGMLLQKRTDTRGVGISSMRKSIYIPPYNHTHRFHPLPLATPTLHNCHPYFELCTS